VCLVGREENLSVACSCYSPDPPFRSTTAPEEAEDIQVIAGEDAHVAVNRGSIIDNHLDDIVRGSSLDARCYLCTVSARVRYLRR